MCAPKSQGGKRCLRHAAASVGMVRLAEAKTGLDRETVYETLKELNKEGRKLEAPELKEVNEFLNKEEFVVKHDPELSERDRKLILKNLQKAKDEAEKQGVTGGAFHAWKNLLKRSVAKIKKPIIALGVIGALSFSLAGCSGSLKNDDTPKPNPTSTSVATEDCANQEIGDVIGKQDVKEDDGVYCHVGIDPNAAALKKNAKAYDSATFTNLGISEDKGYEFQKKTVEFFASEGLDSTILEKNTNKADGEDAAAVNWVKQNKSLFNDTVYNQLSQTGQVKNSTIIVNGYMPKLVHDGKARLDKSSIDVVSVYAKKDDAGNPQVVVELHAEASYRADDASTLDFLTRIEGKSEADVKQKYPELLDNKGINDLVMKGNFAYAYSPTDGKIVGNSAKYNLLYSKEG